MTLPFEDLLEELLILGINRLSGGQIRENLEHCQPQGKRLWLVI